MVLLLLNAPALPSFLKLCLLKNRLLVTMALLQPKVKELFIVMVICHQSLFYSFIKVLPSVVCCLLDIMKRAHYALESLAPV